jgi:hypothetical protein
VADLYGIFPVSFSCRPARSTVTVTGAALASRLVRSRILARSAAVVTAMFSTDPAG